MLLAYYIKNSPYLNIPPIIFYWHTESFNSIFSADTPMLDIVKDDPDDNKFIECAVALKCSYIISGDKHLKEIKNYMGIKILNPKEFLTEYEKNRKH